MFWIIVCVKFCWKSASMVTEIFAKQHRDHFYGTPCKSLWGFREPQESVEAELSQRFRRHNARAHYVSPSHCGCTVASLVRHFQVLHFQSTIFCYCLMVCCVMLLSYLSSSTNRDLSDVLKIIRTCAMRRGLSQFTFTPRHSLTSQTKNKDVVCVSFDKRQICTTLMSASYPIPL